MSKTFQGADAKKLVKTHEELLNQLTLAIEQSEAYEYEIKETMDQIAYVETEKILKEIPVEELNRDKRGFRIKILKDAGYETIADVLKAPTQHIIDLNGISEDMTYEIQNVAMELEKQVESGVKIKLSSDNKTPDTTKLILLVSKYRKSMPYLETCQKLYENTAHTVCDAIGDLKPATNPIKWFFTSKQKKQKASDAFFILEDLLNDTYGRDAKESLEMLSSIMSTDSAQAWRDFETNPIRFFNMIEKICPNRLGTDKAEYGLPEELAQEIEKECIYAEGLSCELRRYQEWGVKYILHQQRVLLGDEMGLGKTIQAIATMVSLKNTGATHFVVVCPASVVTNWCREIQKHSDLQVIKVHGPSRSAALKEWLASGGVAVTTYETTVHFVLEDAFKFTLLVVDEAHYIKNPNARRTIYVKEISLHAERLLFMSGTAIENKVNEMIELIQVLQPDVALGVRGMEALASAPQFREKVAPVYYRRKREDVLTELPDLIESKEWCVMSAEEEQIYEEAVLNRRYAEARRVSWNVPNIEKSSKAKRLLEIVEASENEGRKVIVFSFFLDTIDKVRQILGNRCMEPINGSVSVQRRQEIIDEFNQAPAGTVLAAQIQSGGTGLNIQSASVVVICEPQFKPSIENQAISRAYRMGQTRNVLVYRLLCDDTVDEKITAILEEKQEIFDAFADKSVVAKESLELDEKSFGNIMKEEVERINAKREKAKENL